MRFQALPWVSLAALLAAPFACRAEGADGQAIAPEAYTQPQRSVALPSGCRLNLFCIGDGEPTVVFEGGLGENTMTWRHVQQPVAALTRACSYDRAGYGFSDPAERASDARNTVEDLHDLLRQAGIKLPVVMVGHSIGGLYDTLYAETYPQDVAGMVLVDPSFRNQFSLFAAAMTAGQQAAARATMDKLLADDRKCLELARSGILSKPEQQTSDCLDNPPHADPVLHAELNRQFASLKHITANVSEWQSTGPADHWLSLNDIEMTADGPHLWRCR